MAPLLWDQVGERHFEAGLDRGVLYLPDGTAVAWNGLTAIDENVADASTPYHLDGVKYLNAESLGDFAATLHAFTYPDEFEPFIGVSSYGNGLLVYDQTPDTFNLSYRTRLGNDLEGVDLGYEIHILYNVKAVPDVRNYQSLAQQVTPVEFAWALSTTPEIVDGYRPTAHVVLNSTELDPEFLTALEGLLYGTVDADPNLPPLQELINTVTTWATIVITDNGDGTWTATIPDPDVSEDLVMLDSTTFQISNVDATYLDPDTYEVSTTFLPNP